MIRRLWCAVKRAFLLMDIFCMEELLEGLESCTEPDVQAIDELRGMIALARARLDSEEFNPAAKAV